MLHARLDSRAWRARAFIHGTQAREIARAILDGLLEYEGDTGFVSGPGALRALGLRVPRPARTVTGQLSLDAVQLAACLTDAPRGELAAQLYAHHRRPLTPLLASRFGSGQEVRRFLGVRPGDSTYVRLAAGWSEYVGDSDGSWIVWRPRSASGREREALRHKVYLSPGHLELPSFLERFAPLLDASGAAQFKFGGTAHAILRPDNVVVYFREREAALAAARRFERGTRGVAGQGVPFTSQVGSSGLVSWGIDPPRRDGERVPESRATWRLWVCFALARYLRRAAGTFPAEDRVDYALARIALDGVSPATWAADPETWTVA